MRDAFRIVAVKSAKRRAKEPVTEKAKLGVRDFTEQKIPRYPLEIRGWSK